MILCLTLCVYVFFFFKQKTAYEMRISDWSSDVCSSDLRRRHSLPRLPRLNRLSWYFFKGVRPACPVSVVSSRFPSERSSHCIEWQQRLIYLDRTSVV